MLVKLTPGRWIFCPSIGAQAKDSDNKWKGESFSWEFLVKNKSRKVQALQAKNQMYENER